MKLYRYISFEDFVNLAINNKDRFVRPPSWDDKYEGYLFSFMETYDDVRQIVSEMYYNLCPENYYAISDNYFRMWHSKWFTYAQCWSKHPETDAIWRCYSYGNRAIRIRTKDDKLLANTKKVFPEEKQFNVYLEKVNYDLNKKSILKQQINHMKNSLSVYETYLHKRPEFRHEGEYRLLIADNRLYIADRLSSSGVKFKIEEQVEGKTGEEIIDYLTEKICSLRTDYYREKTNLEKLGYNDVVIEDAGDIFEFIEGVMVHPLAPKWYADIIKDICQSKKIKFDGQSEIYKLK